MRSDGNGPRKIQPLPPTIEFEAFSGPGRGQLIGLRWQDVGFENLILHIRRLLVAMAEGAPKTEACVQDVPVDGKPPNRSGHSDSDGLFNPRLARKAASV